MSIISYAQNFEDVMLWRALKHVEKGFYIDIGAQDPVIDSVSMAFHDRGWKGIHVEPTAYYAELLRQQRQGDVVIQAAIGTGSEIITFFEIADTGISTGDAAIASQHRDRGFQIQEITVPCITLSAVFERCNREEIHWLKIDVEGFESQVLSSWGQSVARPWIVVIESTLPLSQIETHQAWENTLIAYQYSPVYFDGLNRYYISHEHPELTEAFLTPPNVFDGFSLNGTASASFHKLIETRHQQAMSSVCAERELEKKNADEREQLITQELQAQQNRFLELESTSNFNIASLQSDIRDLHYSHHIQVEQYKAQQQTAQNKIDYLTTNLTLINVEREKKEQIFSEQLAQLNQKLESALQHQYQREQEIASQLVTIHTEAAREKVEQIEKHTEQMRMSKIRYDAEVLKQRDEYHNLEKKYATLEMQFKSEQQEQTYQYQNLEKEFAALDIQLRTEQQIQQQYYQKLLEAQLSIEALQTSLSWQVTAPLRFIVSRIWSGKKRELNFASIKKFETELLHTDSPRLTEASKASFIQNASSEFGMLLNKQIILPASTLNQLLAYNDQYFIHCAYHTLLKREPDLDGFNYYLCQLRSGTSKIFILKQLRFSKEGKENSSIVYGLDKAILRHRRAHYPLIGWLFKIIYGVSGLSQSERQWCIIEQQLFLLRDENNRRFSQIESRLAILPPANAPVVSDQNELIKNQISRSSIPQELNQFTPRARNIYCQLKTAIVRARRSA